MTVTDVRMGPTRLTMEVTCEFSAPVARVWQLWADPRQLERWWGPPTYPATVVAHDLTPGGTVHSFMTGPDGDRHHGWWRVLAVDPPRRLDVRDGFGDDPDNPAEGMPTNRFRVRIDDAGAGRTRMTIETVFPSLESMEQLLAMGMEQGIGEALGQIDALLAG